MVTSLQWRVMGLTWTYAIIQNDRFELGAGLGVHCMDLDVRANVRRASPAMTPPSPAAAGPRAGIRLADHAALLVDGPREFLHGALNRTFGVLERLSRRRAVPLGAELAIGAGYSRVRLKLDSVTHSDPGWRPSGCGALSSFVRASF